jgi:integrase
MRKLPKFITLEEYNKIVEHIKKEQPCSWQQYLIAITLSFQAGLRISEIIGYKDRVPALTSDKIDLNQHTIRIDSGKGQKDRIVPLPKVLTEKHIKMLPITLSRRSLQLFVTKLGKELLNKEISFHSLRHGFGSHLASSGRPIHEIQMLMGHSRMDTTGIYLHANPKQAVDGARELF